MLRVGLTGGVGSGKSLVAEMLKQCGAQVSSSDEIGRALMQPGEDVFNQIIAHFGPQVLTQEGVLDRGVLARLAFEDGRAEELNGIVHPAVIAAQAQWLDSVAFENAQAVAVVESALICETKWSKDGSPAPWRTRFDRLVLVTAPIQVRRARYIQRLGGSVPEEFAKADFARRAAVQWSDEQKSALADVVLRNAGTVEDLRSTVEQLFGELRRESVDRAVEAM